MKAKEYAKRFLANPDRHFAYAELGNEMMREFSDLVAIRKAKAPRAVIAIILEQSRKWKRIRELVSEKTDLTEAGFYAILSIAIPIWSEILYELPIEEQKLAEDGLAIAKALKKSRGKDQENG